MKVRLLIAEDHALVRDGMRLLLSRQPKMAVIDETGDGAQVLDRVRVHRPDVLLLDLGLPGLDGLSIMTALAADGLATRVLVVTARLDAASVRASLALGAAGYLPKSEQSDELLLAIRKVAAGQSYVSPEVAAFFEPAANGAALESAPLTVREQEVLIQVGRGLSSKEIARALGISDLTVRKHRENLCRKLDLRNAAELVAFAVRSSL